MLLEKANDRFTLRISSKEKEALNLICKGVYGKTPSALVRMEFIIPLIAKHKKDLAKLKARKKK